jgi:thiamine-phosphate pyrophosphorylase
VERPHNMLELRRTMREIDWRLCLVADTEAAGTRNLVSIIQEAAEAGATLIQLRGKNYETREFLDLAFRTSEILRSTEIPLFINDRVDVALACGADGVHLGQQDMPLVYARKLMGKDRLIGISVNTLEEALDAVSGGADYIGAGPVFFTSSKEKIPAILGLDGLRSLRKKVHIPILAIGGITVENAGAMISAGVDGIAVISAVMGAKNIATAIRNLLKGWDSIRARS